MTHVLTEAQQAIEQCAYKFADEYLEPILAELDRGLVFPRALVDQLAVEGFLGLVLPQQSGVAGAGFVSHIEALQALSQSCPAIASILNNHALFAYAVAHWGNGEQKQNYLPALAKGEKLGTIAILENGPRLGTGPGALLAARQGRGFTLNGTKAFVRNAGAADCYLVFATLQTENESNELTVFLIDAKSPGLNVGQRLETMGLRACPVAHLSFKDVPAEPTAIIGSENNGSRIAAEILSISSVAEAAQTIGIAQAAVRHAAEYAKNRVQFHHPIAKLQAIETILAEIATNSQLAWLGVRQAAQLIEDGVPFESKAAMVKEFLGRFGSKMLVDAIQVEGGMGICEAVPKHISGPLPLARMLRDIAGTTLSEVPNDFPGELIAESIAKHQASQ